MVIVLKQLIDARFHLVFLVCLLILFIFLKKERYAKINALVLLFYAFIIYFTPIPDFLLKPPDYNYYPTSLQLDTLNKAIPYHILVLGTDANEDTLLPFSQRLDFNFQIRLLEGIRMFHALPGSTIITTGSYPGKSFSHGEVAAKALHDLGIPKNRIAFIKDAETTAQEAAQYANIYGADSTKVILVSDYSHLPRASEWFQKYQIYPILAPAQSPPKTKSNKETRIQFSDFKWKWDRLQKWNLVMNQLAGKIQLYIPNQT